MRRKGKKAAAVSIIVAGALVIALLTAGAILRMRTQDMGFGEAFMSFVRDTFNPGA